MSVKPKVIVVVNKLSAKIVTEALSANAWKVMLETEKVAQT